MRCAGCAVSPLYLKLKVLDNIWLHCTYLLKVSYCLETGNTLGIANMRQHSLKWSTQTLQNYVAHKNSVRTSGSTTSEFYRHATQGAVADDTRQIKGEQRSKSSVTMVIMS